MDRLELPETGRVVHAGHGVVAANIWKRASLDDPEAPVALRAQILVGEEPATDVAEGDQVTIGDERWRVEEIVEDAANRRGHVTIARIADR